jgi:hypothetical protein
MNATTDSVEDLQVSSRVRSEPPSTDTAKRVMLRKSNVFGRIDSSLSIEPTLIAESVGRYAETRQPENPLTMREYLSRMHKIPRAAFAWADINAFATPEDMNVSALRLSTGMLSSRFLSKASKALLDEPDSLSREMLLIAFEAKPRPISYSITGYRMSDFIAYIYQDVAMSAMNLSSSQRARPFKENVENIKSWFLLPPGKGGPNSARRHVRRRLMALLDRTNHQAASLFEDREIPGELPHLIHKLMERDDDQGFMAGDLRDFRLVRQDFNLLAEYCMRSRYASDVVKIDALDRVICPSKIKDFSAYVIDLPRGRSASKDRPKMGFQVYEELSRKQFLRDTAKTTVQSIIGADALLKVAAKKSAKKSIKKPKPAILAKPIVPDTKLKPGLALVTNQTAKLNRETDIALSLLDEFL